MDMYVEALTHELMHANDPWWTNVATGFYDFLFYPDISDRHTEIYRDSKRIGREYAHEYGDGG